MSNRRVRTSGGRKRGYEPYLRLVGLVLILVATMLVFGVVVVDVLFVVSTALGVLGAILAAFPGVVLSAFAAL
jgi:hypothetical protein